MRLTKLLRPVVERWPLLANWYRLNRDFIRYNQQKPTATTEGFQLMGNDLMASGKFEPLETEYLKSLMNKAEVLIDVGANIGYYSCMARSKELTVLAIEPLWSNLQYLYANLKANKYDDVEVFPMGVGKRQELAVLYGLGGAASMRKDWSVSGVSTIIPVTTLDRLVEGRYDGSEILIKIDVEGLEYEVLKGIVYPNVKTENRVF